MLSYLVYHRALYCSKAYASEVASHVSGNSTLNSADYFLHSTSSSSLPSVDATKQLGNSHVSVIGPDDDFVAATVSVIYAVCQLSMLLAVICLLIIYAVYLSCTGNRHPIHHQSL